MYVSVIQLYYKRITGRISSWMAYNNRAMKKKILILKDVEELNKICFSKFSDYKKTYFSMKLLKQNIFFRKIGKHEL